MRPMSTVRRALALAALLLAGCSGVSQPVTGRLYDQYGCQIGCDRCAPEALCISTPYVSACLPRCIDASECGGGMKCAVIDGNMMNASVCLAPRGLTVCHDQPCPIHAQCRDDATALVPLPATFAVCGWSLEHCDSGCDAATGNCK